MYDLKLGDCLELMKELPDKSVDMICCDLPFGVTQNSKDIQIPFGPLWEQYNRIIKPNGAIVLFAQGLFYVDLVNSNRKNFRYDIIWDKELTTGFLNANRMPLRSHESIAVFYNHLPKYNAQMIENGIPLHSKGKAYSKKNPKNQNYGKFDNTDDSRAGSTQKYPRSIWKFPKPHPSIVQHPTEKSIDLLMELILTYTDKGDLVLDNCMGSCTTGIGCLRTNRDFIGMEIDNDYFEISKNRMKEELEKIKKASI